MVYQNIYLLKMSESLQNFTTTCGKFTKVGAHLQQNTGNVCIEPSKCESACAESMPKQLEEILFEERIARTTYAKYVSMELCIRGCTDRKVGFQDIDAKITTWEFQEIDQSKQECNDMCELTVTGTVQKKQEMDLNDATIARQSSSTTEDVH